MKASDAIKKNLAPPKAPPKARRRKPGLLHGMRGVEVEDVTSRMDKPCAMCANKPQVRRLVVTSGGGRYGKTDVYCIKCGADWLITARFEYERAEQFLWKGAVPPRLLGPNGEPVEHGDIRL